MKSLNRRILLFTTAAALSAALAAGQGLEALRGKVTRHRLENGLTFLLLERHTSPTVSFHIYYDVGSVDENLGQTGIAHLYEHMAFKGTKTLGTRDYQAEAGLMQRIDEVAARLVSELDQAPPDTQKIEELELQMKRLQEEQEQYIVDNELGQLYERHGAVGLNASTQMDATEYTVSLPANKIELWAAIESDRMAHSVLRQFYSERDVVMEERRLRIDTQPFGKLYENFIVHAFVAHPYGLHSGIGWESDLRRITREQTEQFYRKYYTPANTIIALVGDFHTRELIPVLERYFSSLPSAPDPPRVHTREPEQEGERRVYVEYPSQPFLIIGYRRPAIDHPDDVVFDVIENILSSGRTSRLYRSLVEEKKVAVQAIASAYAFLTYGKYPTLFLLVAVPRAPHTAEEVEAAFHEEIEKLKKEGVTERELQKTLNQLDAAFIRGLRSNSGLAQMLAQTEALTGRWETLLEVRQKFASVSRQDVMRVANQYFARRNRTVAVLHPPDTGEETPEAASEAAAPPADEASQKAGQELFNQMVEGAGGKAALQSIRNRIVEADFFMTLPQGETRGSAKSFTLYPDRMRTDLTVGPQQVSQILSGEQGWIIYPGATQEAPPQLVTQLQVSLEKDLISLLKSGFEATTRLQALPGEKLEEREQRVLLLRNAQGREYRISAEPESFRISKVFYRTLNQFGQPTQAEDQYEDYREVQGLVLPFAVVSYQAGKKMIEQKLTRVEINGEMDPRIFER